MGETLTVIMRWLHISSAVTLVGGIVYARMVMIPAAASLGTDVRAALEEGAAKHFRPIVLAAMVGLVTSGCFNYLSKPGHSLRYYGAFGLKVLLALHIFGVSALATRPHHPRRARLLLGAAISGAAIVLISAYLRGIA